MVAILREVPLPRPPIDGSPLNLGQLALMTDLSNHCERQEGVSITSRERNPLLTEGSSHVHVDGSLIGSEDGPRDLNLLNDLIATLANVDNDIRLVLGIPNGNALSWMWPILGMTMEKPLVIPRQTVVANLVHVGAEEGSILVELDRNLVSCALEMSFENNGVVEVE